MTGGEYEKYKDIFPEIRDKKNWEFSSDECSIPYWEYTGPSLESLKRDRGVEEYQYDI